MHEPLPLALVIVLYSVFWAAVLPQFEAVTLAHLGAGAARYSRIRLWGSVGFVVASAAIGLVLESRGPGALPWLLLGLMASIAAMSFLVTEPDARIAAPATTRCQVRCPWRAWCACCWPVR